MNKKRLASLYFVVDWLASILAWSLFYFFRKAHEDLYINYWDRITNSFNTPSFWLGVIIIPICWLILHAVTGAYEKVYQKSRLKELGQTFFITLLGVVVLFFVVILDDEVASYKSYYQSFIALFTLQFVITYIPRVIITTSVISRIRNKKIGFNTLIVGGIDNACAIFKVIEEEVKPSGRRLIGFLNVYDKKEYKLADYLPRLGSYHEIEQIVKEHNVEEVIIAIERSEVETMKVLLSVVDTTEANVKIWSTDNEFIIENGDNSHYTMTVYNVLGQTMMQQQINAGSTERIGHNLATGLYVISLQNNQNKVAVKVIVGQLLIPRPEGEGLAVRGAGTSLCTVYKTGND